MEDPHYRVDLTDFISLLTKLPNCLKHSGGQYTSRHFNAMYVELLTGRVGSGQRLTRPEVSGRVG